MSTSLFDQVQAPVGARVARPVEGSQDGPLVVSDGSQIKRIIEAVLQKAALTPSEWEAAKGHRSVTMEEHPWIIEAVVGANLTEDAFAWRVQSAINDKLVGTNIYGIANREYTGTWRVGKFEVSVGGPNDRVAKLDGRRQLALGKIAGADDALEWHPDLAPPADFVLQNKPVVRWVIQWVDVIDGAPVRRDIHGREQAALDVKVDNSQLATTMQAFFERLGGSLRPDVVPSSVAPPPTTSAGMAVHKRPYKKKTREAAKAGLPAPSNDA